MSPPNVDSPYVGLVPYTEEDAHFFFGRERDQRIVVANLFASHLTLLYGASGVGKSSLLRAGVIKQLRARPAQHREAGEPPDLVVVYFNEWQGQLLARLRDAFRQAFTGIVATETLERALDRPALSDVVSALGEQYDGDLFIVLDQFEEFFLYHGHGPTPDGFEIDLARLANRTGQPVSLLVSLRDDALSKLDHFKALIPNLFANYLRLRHLSADEARDAICKPLEAYNALEDDQKRWPGRYTAHSDVVAAVIEEVRTGRVTIGDIGKGQVATSAPESVETPYLQLVMTELWRRETEIGSRELRRSTLAALGGAASIVRNHLNTTMNSLDEDERQVCVSLFQFLVTPSGTKIAHSAADLAGFAKRPLETIELVLSRLSGSGMRILSPVAPPSDRPGPIRYEIYHDSLAQAILEWRRRFVEDKERGELEREAARQRAELEQARALAEANRARADAESRRAAEQRRASRLFKILTGALTVVTAAALLLALQSWRDRRRAVDLQRQSEDLVRHVADQQQLRAANAQLQAREARSEQERERMLALSEEYRKQAEVLTKQSQQIQTNANQSDPAARDLQARLSEAMMRIKSLEAAAAGRPSATVVQERDAAQREVKDVQVRLTEAQAEVERLKKEVSSLQARPQAQTPPSNSAGPFRIPDEYIQAHNEVRRTLERYGTALTLGQVDALAQVYPAHDVKDFSALRQFAMHVVTETIESMTFDSQEEATVSCEEVRTLSVNMNTRAVPERSRVVFKVKKGNRGWQIVGNSKK